MIRQLSFQGFEARPFADVAGSKAEDGTGQCSRGGKQAGAAAPLQRVIPDANPQPGKRRPETLRAAAPRTR